MSVFDKSFFLFGCECRGALTWMSSKTRSHDSGYVKCAINEYPTLGMGEYPLPLGENFSSILFRKSGFKGSRILGFKGKHNRFSLGPLTP
jgi:hypothetical protein